MAHSDRKAFISLAAACEFASVRLIMATLAPSLSSRMAMALLIPLPAPVTTATWSANRFIEPNHESVRGTVKRFGPQISRMNSKPSAADCADSHRFTFRRGMTGRCGGQLEIAVVARGPSQPFLWIGQRLAVRYPVAPSAKEYKRSRGIY